MESELELYFEGDDAALEIVEYSTLTALENQAFNIARQKGARGYSFGPPVPRDENGLVLYGEHRGRR